MARPSSLAGSRPPRVDDGGGIVQPLPRGDHDARMLVLVVTLLVAFGTVMVASASEGVAATTGGSTWGLMTRDLVYLGFGAIAFYVVARVRLSYVVRRAPLVMTIALGLLVAVKIVGVSANGGKRWLNLHIIDLQPSELFKLATVLFVAWAVDRHGDEFTRWGPLARWMLPVVAGAGLIVIEPDIGTSSVVVAIAFVMLATAGLAWRKLAWVACGGLLGFGGYMIYRPYSARRFFSFLHPNQDLLGSGYQLLQSKIGLGAGGLTGLGLGHSREKWGLLPNPHTDFIFTIVGEELGLLGTVAVIALFAWFLFVAVRIAERSSNGVYRVMVVGVTAWIMLEVVINVASVVGWWAVTGVPLPFFSYGGTALITELAAMGLVYNVAHDRGRASPAPDQRYSRHRPERGLGESRGGAR